MRTAATIALTAVLAMSAPADILYETDFATGHVNLDDWSLTGTISIVLDSGLDCDGGWGSAKSGTLTGDAAIDLADVTVFANCAGVGTGNSGSCAEVAGRTSTTTDGVYVRVHGAWSSADIELYDNGTVIASIVDSNIDSQNYAFTITLALSARARRPPSTSPPTAAETPRPRSFRERLRQASRRATSASAASPIPQARSTPRSRSTGSSRSRQRWPCSAAARSPCSGGASASRMTRDDPRALAPRSPSR